jgi:5'-methylthioadenosine phosphorylase
MVQGKKAMVILGSGLYDLYKGEIGGASEIDTQYGAASVYSSRSNSRVYLLLRHGKGHSVPPHMINYRANIMAAKKLGISYIIATSAVGSMNEKIGVGSYVIIDQFLDFTKSRQSTFFSDIGHVQHTDVSYPYSKEVRDALIKALKDTVTEKFAEKGTYVCSEGPRYETAAEIEMFRRVGGDVAGMTGVPEVVLANELSIPYATISYVTNMCAGMQSSLSHDEVVNVGKSMMPQAKRILNEALSTLLK